MSNPAEVLIIEDDQWLAESFQRTLRAAGYTSAVVPNGRVAMEMIDAAPPRAIVLDILLTGGTGITLLHELQSYNDTAHIPIVMCTNLAAHIDMKSVAPYGVRRVLDKTTMTPDDVAAAIRSVLL